MTIDYKLDPSILYTTTGLFRKNLFKEFGRPNKKYPAVYTMREYDHDGYISAYQIYMDCIDDYEFAVKVFGSYSNFLKYLDIPEFTKGPRNSQRTVHKYYGFNAWKREKELRDKSEARKLLWKSARAGNVTAQKLLYEGDKPRAGRPSKNQVAKEARQQAEQERILDEGLSRIKTLRLISNTNDAPS